MVAQRSPIVYYYDHMNLTYSSECSLIIADTNIMRYEKVRTIYPTCDDLESDKFFKKANHTIKIECYWPSPLDSSSTFTLYIEFGASEKKYWVDYLCSTHFDVKNSVSILITSLKGLFHYDYDEFLPLKALA